MIALGCVFLGLLFLTGLGFWLRLDEKRHRYAPRHSDWTTEDDAEWFAREIAPHIAALDPIEARELAPDVLAWPPGLLPAPVGSGLTTGQGKPGAGRPQLFEPVNWVRLTEAASWNKFSVVVGAWYAAREQP